jgi:hypothetical protein
MIFCRDVLFVHVPKTGGMALTTHLLHVLPRPIYYSLPKAHSLITDPGVILIPGVRHENLAEARELVGRYGYDINRFPLILAAVRNPYALEVSRYAYLQKGHPWDRGHNQRLAMEEDFETFAVESFDHGGDARPIQSYFELEGRTPPNLRVLRTERLADDLRDSLASVGIAAHGPLPRENDSSHGPWERYYTRAAEEAVYDRYRWVFDRGFYSRIDQATFPFVETPPVCDPAVPLAGPVRQIGAASGLWHDRWVGNSLRFLVRAREAVNCLTVEGRFPYEFAGGLELTVSVDDRTTRSSLGGRRGDFRMEVPVSVEPGGIVGVHLSSSRTFCPREVGRNEDTRSLSFILDHVVFRLQPDPERAPDPARAAKSHSG